MDHPSGAAVISWGPGSPHADFLCCIDGQEKDRQDGAKGQAALQLNSCMILLPGILKQGFHAQALGMDDSIQKYRYTIIITFSFFYHASVAAKTRTDV